MTGWAETPGGGMLARLISDAFARAAESDKQQSEQESSDPEPEADDYDESVDACPACDALPSECFGGCCGDCNHASSWHAGMVPGSTELDGAEIVGDVEYDSIRDRWRPTKPETPAPEAGR